MTAQLLHIYGWPGACLTLLAVLSRWELHGMCSCMHAVVHMRCARCRCGHCKKLEPIYVELGEAYKGEGDVVIAKMDATANDVDDDRFDVQGFPTIMFVSSKGEVKEYSGGRTLSDFKEFLAKETGIAGAANETAEAETEPAEAGEKKDAPKDEL
jgi:thioredoxin-like negative regulator of GroEL